MAAAEHQRARTVEGVSHCDPRRLRERVQQRKANEKRREQAETHEGSAARSGRGVRSFGYAGRQQQTRERAESDHQRLHPRLLHKQKGNQRSNAKRGCRHAVPERPRHPDHRLRHNGNGDQHQAVKHARPQIGRER